MKLTVLFSFLMISGMFGASDSFYGFQVKDISGNAMKLDGYKGKVVLVVNTASNCGYTPQYKALQELYSRYSDRGLVILGVPANNFGGQEPGSNAEIKEFCAVNFKVSFPMTEKVSVRGADMHPLFMYLTSAENPDFKGDIRWNFEKFLISKDGKLLRRFRSGAGPTEKEMLLAVEAALK